MRGRSYRALLLLVFAAIALIASGCAGGGGGGSGGTTPVPTTPANTTPVAVDSVLVTQGPATGGTEITILGKGFFGNIRVMIGNREATNVRVSADGTRITAIAPPAATNITVADIMVISDTNGQAQAPIPFQYQPPPTLSVVSPIRGPLTGGTSVTLSGTNLLGTLTVKFGGQLATGVVGSPDGTRVVCVTQATTTEGAVDVEVESSISGKVTAAGGFTFFNAVPAFPPTVQTILPNHGTLAGGTQLTITGQNFRGLVGVTVGGSSATNVVVNTSGTLLTCNTPAGAGAGPTNVIVSNGDGTSATVTNGFTYDPPMVIASVSPASGPNTGGTLVTIDGSGFLGNLFVRFGGQPASSVTVNGARTRITCVSPPVSQGAVVDVDVLSDVNGSATAAGAFTFTNPPLQVTGSSPGSGPLAGGTLLSIQGVAFLAPVTVTVGGVVATNVTVGFNQRQLTCRTPPGASAGPVDIVVSSPVNGAATLTGAFTYNPLPLIASVTPPSGPQLGGVPITIAGSGFLGTTTVSIDGVGCSNVAVSALGDSITCVTPAAANGAGARTLLVTCSAAGTATSTYTYNALPTISSIVPGNGPLEGGTQVAIDGASFEGTVNVTIDGQPATVTGVNGARTQVSVSTPPGFTLGPVDVELSASLSGEVAAIGAFSYDPNPPPTIALVSPNSGPLDGGTPITITGTNFKGNVSVLIDGDFCTGVTANTSGTQITCVTPPSVSGLAGPVTLEIVSDTHGQVALGGGYTYNPRCVVSQILPNNGPQTGGNPVVINGFGFGGTVTVLIGRFPATNVVVNGTADQITCIAPGETSSGDFDVEVRSSANGNGVLPLGYHFNDKPTIDGVTPADGPLAGGTPLTIDGSNFGGTVNVTLDGLPCANVSVSAAGDLITCTAPAVTSGPGPKRMDLFSSVNGPATRLNAFTYNPTPTITAVTPAVGPEQGGTSVDIDGTGFLGTVNVTIGTVAANVITVNGQGTRINVETPTSPNGGGPRDVIVTSDRTGLATRLNGFTYNPSPTIASVAPNSGPIAGGTPVTILGTNFVGTVTVSFGTMPALNVVVSGGGTRIDCVTQASPTAGAVDVTVTSSTHGTQVSANAYTYVPPGPFFPSIVPNEGPSGTATSVIITGFNLFSVSQVTFGGSPAANVTSNASGTIVTCDTPALFVTGDVDVVLTSATNGVSTSVQGYRYNPPPAISSVVPPDGPLAGGNQVVVNGTSFRGAVSVTVDGVPAFGATANTTGDQVTFTAPAGASVGLKVLALNCAASGLATSTYTYNPTPTVVSVAPPDGKQDGGDALTITGTNFFGTVTVTIDGAPATNVVVNGARTQIFCNAPAATSGPGAKDVVVSSSSHGSATLVGGYTYNPRPLVSLVTPPSGPLGGTNNVTLDGLNFLGTVNVTIDGVAAPTVSVSSTRIIATVPASTTGTGAKALIVDTSRAGSVTLNPGYTYNPAPSIAAVVPSQGSVQGGTTVTIVGAFFGGNVSVNFGANPATNIAVNTSLTQITCSTPASAFAGAVDVTVNASANGSVTRTGAFTYLPAVFVTAITPNNGPLEGNQNVTITGGNFGGAVTVNIEGAPCSNVRVNAAKTQINCVTGASINGICSGGIPCKDVNVVSSTNGQGGLSNGYAYNAPPQIVGPIVPNNGPLEGGTPITISGNRFDPTISVAVDGVLCTGVVVTGNTTITCFTPPARAGVGPRDVTVFSTRNGTARALQGFRYNEQLTVTQIVPNEGPVAGGTTINITGTFFNPVPNPINPRGLTVEIDGAPCTGVTVNASQTVITCVTPPSPNLPPDDVGPKTVVVRSDRNGTAVIPNGFTYRPLPTFLGINPNNGPLAGGTIITIDGSDFRGTVTVTIDGAPATQVTVNTSFSSLTAVTPASPSGIGPKDVVVNTTGAGSVTQPLGFTYNPTPTVILINPDQGPVAGGNTIQIDGTGFRDTLNVSIDNVLATNVTANVSGTSMTLIVPASTSGQGPKTVGIDSSRDGMSFFANAYTYRNTPTFTAITPNNGPLAGGQAIAITGTNFFGNITVTIDGAPCTNVTSTALGDRIDCTTPPSPSGTGPKNVQIVCSASGTLNLAAAYTYNPAPTVTTVVPDNGPLGGGTPIVITGTNFLNTVGVTIGGNACTGVTVNPSATRIDCVTPASTTGVGAKVLTVDSSSNGPVTLIPGFTYNATPTIISLAPAEGPLAGGNTITVNGTDFRGTCQLFIDGQSCTVTAVSPAFTSLTAIVPPSLTGTGLKDVQVIASLAGTVTNTAAYRYNPLPGFTGISPDNGPQAGNTTITITGSTFRGNVQVLIGGVPCTNVVVAGTSDSLTARTPASATTGLRDVVVGCTLSGTVTAVNAWTYNPSPTVISIVPGNGPEGGGTAIAITGTDFRGTVAVTIDGRPCTGVTVNPSQTRIDCVTPASLSGPGSKDVQIDASLSGTALIPNGFVYNITPGVVSIVPNEGPNQGGQQVLITGTDFFGTIDVHFGPNAAIVGAISPDSTRITVTTPPFAGTGLVDVGINSSTNGNVTITNAYTYNPPPTFSTITPAEGPLSGGTPVVVIGTLFRGAVQLLIDGNPCTNVTVNATATRIDAITPPNSLVGAKTVSVISSLNGRVDIPLAFTYNPGPTIIQVVDNNGPLFGGQTINIFGTGFGGTLNVTIDGVPCTNVTATIARDRITCVTPAAATGPGPKTLSIQSSTNGIVNLAGGFTYNGPPTITSVAPPDGPAAGGQTVIITGTNFNPTVNVTFGSTPATVVSVNATNSQITVLTPPLPVGQNPPQLVGVTVSSTFTGTVTLPNAYTYNVTPTISNINPNNGPLGGGQLVTITGANFRGAVGVTFGGFTATNILVNGGFNQITCRTPPGQFPSIPVDVVVDSSLNGSSTFPLGYTYNNTPSAAQVTPFEGPIAGGTPFTITGAGFVPTVNVIFDTSFASGITVNPTFTRVTGNTPPFVGPFPGEFGTTVPVTVSSSGGGDIPVPPLPNAFTYNPTPTLLVVLPPQGPAQGGGLTELRGKFVGLDPSATVQVLVNGVPSTNVTWTSQDPTLPDNTLPVLPPPGRRNFDRLTFNAPPGPIGTVPITIISSTHGTDTFPARYQYNGAPTITSIQPNNGPMAGGTNVIIVGTGFDPVTTVTIGGQPATGLVFTGNTTISLNTPASATPGGRDVVVFSSQNGTITAVNGFTYNPTPTVGTITPNNGPVAGGQLVTINGSGFGGTVTVQFGATLVPTPNVTVTGPGSLVLMTPPGGAAGPVDVTIDSTQSGQSVFPSAYTYNPQPTITAVTPNSGPVNGATPVVITGTNFIGPATVTIGGQLAGATTVVSPTRITATANPFTLVGPQDVTFNSNLAGIATLPDGFTYTPVFARTPVPMPAGGAVNDVATADFNGDGNADFVTTSPFGTPAFSVLIGGARTDFPVVGATEPANCAVADMNLDGKPDVIVTNRGTNTMFVYLNVMALPTSTPTFTAPFSFPTNGAPGTVQARDLNLDGKPDIVLVCEGTGHINVYTNTTTPGGALSLNGLFLAAGMSGPARFALGDLNADGKPDLVVPELGLGANRITVFPNIFAPGGTAGGFGGGTSFACGNRTAGVAIGDLNGDGLRDIVAVNRQDNTFNTFIHSATPSSMTFTAMPVQATGAGPVAVAIVDLDGAGINDVVTANDGAGTVSVMVNSTVPGSGSVTLTAPADIPCGPTPGNILVVDTNNDGKRDLVLPNRTGDTLSTLTNNTPMGTTPAAFAARQDNPVIGNGPNAVAAADFNLDGKIDFVILNKNSNTIETFTNTTPVNANTFTFSQLTRATAAAAPVALAVGDLNCDGRPDLAVVTESDTCEIYFNNGAATVNFNAASPGVPIVSGGEGARGVTIADFNADGTPDVAVSVISIANRIRVVANLTTPGSSGPFVRGSSFDVPFTTTNPISLGAGDMNGDGYPDIVTGNGNGTNAVQVIVNGHGLDGPSLNVTFTASTTVAVGAGPLAVRVAHANGNGHPDIVTVNNAASITLITNTTGAGGTPPTFAGQVTTPGINGPNALDVGELNGDGRIDVATTNGGDDTAGIFLNDAGGNFPGANLRLFNVDVNPTGAAIGDFNNDGRNDVVILNFGAASVSLLRNITIP